MKKKLLIGFAALALALIAAFNFNLNTQKAELSALSLANVEALAQGETGPEACKAKCYERYGYYCLLETPIAYVYCNNYYPYYNA